MAYKVVKKADGDIVRILDANNISVAFSDPVFTAWNALQTTPYVLGANQVQLQTMKGLSAAQLATATPAQIGIVLYAVLQNIDTGVS